MEEQRQYLESQHRQTEINHETFRKIIRETKELGTKTILFIGGEPFIDKEIFDLITFAKSLGLSTVAVTNAVLLTGENIEKCMKAGLDWLSVSIDGASEEAFSRIRGENYLAKIITNVRKLNELKEEKEEHSPNMVAVCTIMDDNLEELRAVVDLCRDLKVDRVLFQPVVANNIDQTQRMSEFPGFIKPERFPLLERVIDELIAYKKKSPENFGFIGNSIRYLNLIKKYFKGTLRHWDLPCYAGYNRVQIVQEGKIYFCVSQEKYVANFGDVSKDHLKDLWYSPKAKFYRKIIRNCKTPCLQWCSYRDGFIELQELIQKKLIFK